jgi:putative transposase
MAYNGPVRRTPRLKEYNYTQPGAYFVTICTHERECLFGEVKNALCTLTSEGQIVERCWLEIPRHRPYVRLDEFIVMPNHIHCIIHILPPEQSSPVVGTRLAVSENLSEGFARPVPGSLSRIIGSFKSAASREINTLSNTQGRPLWQTRFHDRIIRDEEELSRIREYIINNPAQWEDDKNNPMLINIR